MSAPIVLEYAIEVPANSNFKKIQKLRKLEIGKEGDEVLTCLMIENVIRKEGKLIIVPVFFFLCEKLVSDGWSWESFQFRYESHSCPINWMRGVQRFATLDSEKDGDRNSDPHGLFSFVGYATRERLKELTGYDIAPSAFGLNPAKIEGKLSPELDWFEAGLQLYREFRPDMSEHDLEQEIYMAEAMSGRSVDEDDRFLSLISDDPHPQGL